MGVPCPPSPVRRPSFPLPSSRPLLPARRGSRQLPVPAPGSSLQPRPLALVLSLLPAVLPVSRVAPSVSRTLAFPTASGARAIPVSLPVPRAVPCVHPSAACSVRLPSPAAACAVTLPEPLAVACVPPSAAPALACPVCLPSLVADGTGAPPVPLLPPCASWPFPCVRPLALLPVSAPYSAACPPSPLVTLPRLPSAPRPAPP